MNHNKRHTYKKAAIGILVLVLAFVGIWLLNPDSGTLPNKGNEDANDVVNIGGIKCTPRNNIQSYLFMGVDERGKIQEKYTDDNGTNQVDTLMLLVIDKQNDTYAVLHINRDINCEFESFDPDGNSVGYGEGQLSLAHTHGISNEQKCENVINAVSKLLHNQRIDGYASLNMDAIKVLNHAVGGVTVTVNDDLTNADASLKKGTTLTLSDDQADIFVHDRMNVADGTNLNRISRQKTYMSSLKKKLLQECKNDNSKSIEVFKALKEYMFTNLTNSDVSKITKALLKNTDLGEYEFTGTSKVDEWGSNVFTPDEDQKNKTIIELFYDRMED